MNKGNVKLWLLAGLVLFVAGSAIADYNVRDHSTHYQNSSTGQRVTSAGHLTTVEQDPAMDADLVFPDIINNQTGISLGGADSSTVLDTHRMRLGMLLIKPVISGTGTVDTNTVVTLIFQIRTHLNAQDDSSSTFAIYPYGHVPVMNQTGAAAVSDTSMQGHIYKAVAITAQQATPSAGTAWSGEFSVKVSGSRNARGSSISMGGSTFYYPNGLAISLQSLFGREIYSPYTSVRVRSALINAPLAATVKLNVHLVGTPL